MSINNFDEMTILLFWQKDTDDCFYAAGQNLHQNRSISQVSELNFLHLHRN